MKYQAKIIFKDSTIELWQELDYLDNATFAGKGRSDMLNIYKKLKEEKTMEIQTSVDTIKISSINEWLKWMSENGFDYYLSNLFVNIYNDQSHKIRCEK